MRPMSFIQILVYTKHYWVFFSNFNSCQTLYLKVFNIKLKFSSGNHITLPSLCVLFLFQFLPNILHQGHCLCACEIQIIYKVNQFSIPAKQLIL